MGRVAQGYGGARGGAQAGGGGDGDPAVLAQQLLNLFLRRQWEVLGEETWIFCIACDLH